MFIGQHYHPGRCCFQAPGGRSKGGQGPGPARPSFAYAQEPAIWASLPLGPAVPKKNTGRPATGGSCNPRFNKEGRSKASIDRPRRQDASAQTPFGRKLARYARQPKPTTPNHTQAQPTPSPSPHQPNTSQPHTQPRPTTPKPNPRLAPATPAPQPPTPQPIHYLLSHENIVEKKNTPSGLQKYTYVRFTTPQKNFFKD